MAKRPLYPADVTRKHQELPSDTQHRNSDEKLEAADALQKHWEEDQSFKAVAEHDNISVGETTVARAYWQFFGPTDEDLTFVELGEKYADPTVEDADWSDGLNEYLEARKNDRLDEFKRARQSHQSQTDDDTTATPLNARELEIAREYYQRGVDDTLDDLGVDPEDA